MKVIVDFDRCEANGVCVRCCPEVFRLEEDDTLTLLIEKVPEALRGALRRAVDGCPRQAISVQE